jgi:hypothetical protein
LHPLAAGRASFNKGKRETKMIIIYEKNGLGGRIFENDEIIALSLVDTLEKLGYEVTLFGREALEVAKEEKK